MPTLSRVVPIFARLSIAVLMVVGASPALVQSFNCRSATFPDEVTICQDAELSRLDERVAGLYHAARNQAPANIRPPLDKGQTDWIVARRACGADRSCIQAAYQSRIRDIGQYVQGARQWAKDYPDTELVTLHDLDAERRRIQLNLSFKLCTT